MVYARTNAEARPHMNLHPCASRAASFNRASALVEHGDALASVCDGSCGAIRRVEFQLQDELPKLGVVLGDEQPSQIPCSGEFLAYSDKLAKRVPGSQRALEHGARAEADRVLQRAMAALDDVVKFISDDQDAVPVGAFRSSAGKQLYRAKPGPWRKGRLMAARVAYAELSTGMTA